MQNIANNLPDAFTAGKDVTKSFMPARNVPERIEVPKKTIQLPSSGKSGRSMAIPAGAASRKRNRKEKDTPSIPANVRLLMLGLQNTLRGSYWEMTNRRREDKKFP